MWFVLALDILCICALSAAVKSTFSTARESTSRKHNQLSDRNLERECDLEHERGYEMMKVSLS